MLLELLAKIGPPREELILKECCSRKRNIIMSQRSQPSRFIFIWSVNTGWSDGQTAEQRGQPNQANRHCRGRMREKKSGRKLDWRMRGSEGEERRKGGGGAICSQIPRVLKGWLMTCAAVCPLGDEERKPTLPLPFCDDTSQLAAGISLPTKIPDRLPKCF